MKNTFLNKVAAERAVLRIVNAHTSGVRQLAGLSWVAIDAWQRAICDCCYRELCDDVELAGETVWHRLSSGYMNVRAVKAATDIATMNSEIA